MEYRTQISVDEAIETLEQRAPMLESEEVSVAEARGRTLAEDLASLVDHPSCDNSAMDGYACREADTLMASHDKPVALTLIGDLPAGSVFEGEVGPGEAVGIYTGAPIPPGADAIIMVEETERQGDRVLVRRSASKGDIRPRAQDLEAGKVYLPAGTTLTPAAIGIAAAMGYPRLRVTRKPRVGVLSTGDEVIEPGEPLRDGQVYNANAYAIAELVRSAGAEPVVLPAVIDDLQALASALERFGGVDLLITSGGVSMGKYDFVRDLLFDNGTVHFWKVAMKPGGPGIFGEWQGVPVFGLPGNPVSSMVVFLIITQAWVRKALGSADPLPYRQRITAQAGSSFPAAGFKTAFWRGVLRYDAGGHHYTVNSTGNQSSGVLLSMLKADALVVVPPKQAVEPGQWAEVIPLPLV